MIVSLLSVRLFIFEFLLHFILSDQFHASENYTSTLAHKLNHSFIANCEWSNAEHPCYGLVPSVTTCLDLTEGQELTINYGLLKLFSKHYSTYRNSLMNYSLLTTH